MAVCGQEPQVGREEPMAAIFKNIPDRETKREDESELRAHRSAAMSESRVGVVLYKPRDVRMPKGRASSSSACWARAAAGICPLIPGTQSPSCRSTKAAMHAFTPSGNPGWKPRRGTACRVWKSCAGQCWAVPWSCCQQCLRAALLPSAPTAAAPRCRVQRTRGLSPPFN